MAHICVLSISLFIFLSVGINQSLCVDPFKLICTIYGFDTYNLTAVTWFINVGQQHCLAMNQTQPLSQCTIDLAICHSSASPGPCQNSSICSVSDQRYLSLGAYKGNPLATTKNIEGFQAVFQNGSQYNTASGKSCLLQTNIIFVCNESAIWTTPGISESRMKAPDPKSMSYNNKTCQLSIMFDYAGACSRKIVSRENMSTGTILIVIFFVLLILYFVLGVMINYARGRVGADVIPHAKFWASLPVYIIDGFQFVFCCGRLPVTSTYEQI